MWWDHNCGTTLSSFRLLLPYLSRLCAAGASEPRNLGYMERLGLWGEGTPSFASFPDFLEAVGGRGVGALELVAMDMKARGMLVMLDRP
jgi:hypothetical protein